MTRIRDLIKRRDKDFVILNITDIQFNDTLDKFDGKKLTSDTVCALVERVKPDLITVSGDFVWGMFVKDSLRYFCMLIEQFRIPWAPVIGNHDCEGNMSKKEIAACIKEWCEYCLFDEGPQDIAGIGNYYINIRDCADDGRIIHTLFFMDTGGKREYTVKDADGESKRGGYDHLKYSQIKWYSECLYRLKQDNGGVMPLSTVVLHIPPIQYKYAWREWKKNGCNPELGFGFNNEECCTPLEDNGFFDAVKAIGSTRDIIAGHDHINCASVVYDGVRLTYGLKTGDRGYWKDNMNGGTVITVDSYGNTQVRHEFVKSDKEGGSFISKLL